MAEIVIVPDAAAAGALVADEIVRLVRANPEAVLGLATGSTPLPVYEALPSAAGRRRRVARARVRARRVRRPRPGAPRELPLGDRARGRRAARPRPARDPRARRLARGHRARRRRLRARDRRGRRRRPADPRDRHRRSHRLQRAGLVVRLAHPGEDAHRADARRQRALLRLDRRRAAALHHAGARHDPARPPPRAARVRRGQGRGRRGRGRGAADGVAARARRSSCTRTRRWSSTRPRHPGSRSPTTTATPSRTSPPGRGCRTPRGRPARRARRRSSHDGSAGPSAMRGDVGRRDPAQLCDLGAEPTRSPGSAEVRNAAATTR